MELKSKLNCGKGNNNLPEGLKSAPIGEVARSAEGELSRRVFARGLPIKTHPKKGGKIKQMLKQAQGDREQLCHYESERSEDVVIPCKSCKVLRLRRSFHSLAMTCKNGIATGVNKTNLKVHTFTPPRNDSNVIASTNDSECVAIQKNSYKNDWIASSDLRPPRNDRGDNNRKELIHLFTSKKLPSPRIIPSATNFGKTPRLLRSAGFTLAEVLITLGIIGVVAAMTIPGLMNTYKKKQYYTQFMKARSVIENTLRMYANDNDCEITDGSCEFLKSENIEKLGRYFKGVQYITEDNCTNILSGYDKIPIKNYEYLQEHACSNNMSLEKELGFITIDGMMLLFDDGGYGLGTILDINGPNTGPNLYGRDIFDFYTVEAVGEYYCNSIWGVSKACKEKNNIAGGADCYNGTLINNCGARLIEEGKMNY